MKRSYAIVALIGILTAGVAEAGRRLAIPLAISKSPSGGGYAQGQMADVRNSADTTGFLVCQAYIAPSSQSVTCYANNGTTSLSCSSSDPTLVDALSRFPSDAVLTLYVDSAGACTRAVLTVGSQYAPKTN
jgi:hypothetical protein